MSEDLKRADRCGSAEFGYSNFGGEFAVVSCAKYPDVDLIAPHSAIKVSSGKDGLGLAEEVADGLGACANCSQFTGGIPTIPLRNEYPSGVPSTEAAFLLYNSGS